MTQNEGGLRQVCEYAREFPAKMMNCSLNPHCMPPHTYLQQYGLVPHNITKYRKYVIVAVFSHFGTTFWHDEGSISLALISSLISCYIKLQFGPPFCPRRHRPEKEKILGSRPNAKQHQLSSGNLSPAANANIHCFSPLCISFVRS